MWQLTKKPKFTIDEFTNKFYEKYIFVNNNIENNPWSIFSETTYKLILDSDSDFKVIDLCKFTSELLILRLEVCLLAWNHCLNNKYVLEQNEFTMHYLAENGFNEIWDALANYNKAIAESTVMGYDPESKMGRGKITYLNQMRANLFDEWNRIVSDSTIAARVANRIGSKNTLNNNRLFIQISYQFTDNLECIMNDDARKKVIFTIQGFYNGAFEEIKKVKIVPK